MYTTTHTTPQWPPRGPSLIQYWAGLLLVFLLFTPAFGADAIDSLSTNTVCASGTLDIYFSIGGNANQLDSVRFELNGTVIPHSQPQPTQIQIAGEFITTITIPEGFSTTRNLPLDLFRGQGARKDRSLIAVHPHPAFFIYTPDTACENGNPITPTIHNNQTRFRLSLALNSNVTGEFNPAMADTGNNTIAAYNTNHPICTANPYPDFKRVVYVQPITPLNLQYASSSACQNGSNLTCTFDVSPANFTSTAGLTFVNTQTGEIDVANSQPGTHTVTCQTGGDCPQSATAMITILPPDNLTIGYPDSSYCHAETPVSANSNMSGQWASSPGGLDLDPISGQINPQNSNPNSYTISATSSGNCPVTETTPMEIRDDSLYTWGYGQQSFCQDNGQRTPVGLANVVGTFSYSGPDAILMDISSGEIDRDVLAGSYTLNFSAIDQCILTNPVQLQIDSTPQFVFDYSVTTICQGDSAIAPTNNLLAAFAYSSGPANQNNLDLDPATGLIHPQQSDPGTYQIIGTSLHSCPSKDTAILGITPQQNLSFSYPDTAFCKGAVAVAPNTSLGMGIYSASGPGNIVADPTTGELNLSADDGNYTILFTPLDVCTSSVSTPVRIRPQPQLVVNYGVSSICQPELSITPTSTVPATYRQLPNGNLNLTLDDSTGMVTPGNSDVGTFQIEATSVHICPTVDIVSLAITAPVPHSLQYSDPAYCQQIGTENPVGNLPAGIFTAIGQGNIVHNATTGELDLNATPGPYTIFFSPADPCHLGDSVQIEILPNDILMVVYPDSACLNGPAITPTSNLSAIYSANASGLHLNTLTGQILPDSSQPGTYQITAHTQGTCPDTTEPHDIRMYMNPRSTMNYGSTGECQRADTLSVRGVTAAGTFSSLGLGPILVDTLTGSLDLNAAPGLYTIFFTPDSACDDPDTTQIEIYANDLAYFQYGAAQYCNQATMIGLDTSFITPGGTFTATPIGFPNIFSSCISPSSGAIDVQGCMSPGAWIITYQTDTSRPCPAHHTDTLTIISQPTVEIVIPGESSPARLCNLNEVILPQAVGATGTITWSMNLQGDTTVVYPNFNDTTGSFCTLDSIGTYDLKVKVEDGGGLCSATDLIEVTIDPMKSVSFSVQDTSLCFKGAQLNLEVEANGEEVEFLPTVDSLYKWIPISRQSMVTRNNPIQEMLFDPFRQKSGKYEIEVRTVSDHCRGNDTLTVFVKDSVRTGFQYPGSENGFCQVYDSLIYPEVHPSALTRATFSGFLTEEGNPVIPFENHGAGSLLLAELPAGNLRITHKVTVNGCTDSSRKDLTIHPSPQPDLFVEPEVGPYCLGDTLSFSSFAENNSWVWFAEGSDTLLFGNRRKASGQVYEQNNESLEPGFHDITVWINSDKGCINSDTLTVEIAESPTVEFTLNQTGNIQFEEHNHAEITLKTDHATFVNWKFKDTTEVDLHDNSPIGMEIPDSQSGDVDFTSEDILSLKSFDSPRSTKMVFEPWNTCPGDSIELEITIYPKGRIFIPELVTPNDDGYNDTWVATFLDEGKVDEVSLYLYDRSNRLVAKWEDLTIPLDPNNLPNGSSYLPDGIYWYSLFKKNEGPRHNLYDPNHPDSNKKEKFNLLYIKRFNN